jgi:hypothetical protein
MGFISKVLFFLAISSGCIFYISYTKMNYFYCTYANIYNDYLVHPTQVDMYKPLCQNILQYSEHSLIKLVLTLFYENKYYEISDKTRNELRQWISVRNVYSMKLEIQIIKFCHILIYFLILYILLQVIPNLIFNVLVYLMSNMFKIIFFVLIFEAVLNLYFGVKVDVTSLLMMVKTALDTFVWPIFK